MRWPCPFFVLFLAPFACAEIDPEWKTTVPPFQIADHLYYVGSQEFAAYLVTTPAGNILINANLETSPPQIRASVEKLGLVDAGGQKASYPGVAEDFARTFSVLRSLPCDIFLGAHGSYFGLKTKLPRLEKEGPQVFLDPGGYKEFVGKSQATFETALKKEQDAARH